MGSQAGILHRPIAALLAVAAASASSDIPDKFASFRLFAPRSAASVSPALAPVPEPRGSSSSWVDHISVSKLTNLSFVARILVPVPNVSFPTPSSSSSSANSVPSFSPVLSSYQFPELIKALKPDAITKSVSTPVPDILYRWHLPDPNAIDVSGSSECSLEKSRTVVVLLGWLGSKQKHLKAYADWYTSRGFHAITFTLPMTDMLSYQAGGKTEQNIDMLVHHLSEWLEEEHGKNLVFHTFSNTGWLTYGAILEKFQKEDPPVVKTIRGCIVDSAPVAAPDPQVWASGFSAAFLKKNSIATKGVAAATEPSERILGGTKEVKPAAMEAALLLVLEKFFQVILNLPTVNRRLSDVIGLLSSGQPGCPQLYIYSSADRVIPAGCVESFIEKQRKAGHEVRACNFVSTPHVDHFRNDPKLYSGQLSRFLDDCVLTCCRRT